MLTPDEPVRSVDDGHTSSVTEGATAAQARPRRRGQPDLGYSMRTPSAYVVMVLGSGVTWSLEAAVKLGSCELDGCSFHTRFPAPEKCTSAPPPVSTKPGGMAAVAEGWGDCPPSERMGSVSTTVPTGRFLLRPMANTHRLAASGTRWSFDRAFQLARVEGNVAVPRLPLPNHSTLKPPPSRTCVLELMPASASGWGA